MKNEESLDFDWERVKSFSEPEIVTERRGFLIGVWKLLKCTEFEQSRSLGLLALILSFEKKNITMVACWSSHFKPQERAEVVGP